MTKSGFIAIVGRPNVGKSSLLNALIGEKVAIVSDKPQTTRTKIMGVLTQDETQLVFLDTPGLHKPKTKLSEYMVGQVRDSVADVDIALLVTEATGDLTRAERELIESFKATGVSAIAAVNKIDLLKNPSEMLEKLAALSAAYEFEAIIPISALTRDGLEQLMGELIARGVEGPHYFEDDMLTDQPERVIVSEIIREKILMNMQQEIPHGTAVVIESMKERPDGSMMDIEATIYCEKDSHKGMIIGKKGAMLKKIASEARVEAESFLGIKINLQCWLKVREDWRNKSGLLQNFGFNNN